MIIKNFVNDKDLNREKIIPIEIFISIIKAFGS